MAEGCDFGKGIARQIKALWAVLTVVAALMAVQIILSLGAVNAAKSVQNKSNERAVDVARLDERLSSIENSLKRIEARVNRKQ